MPQHSYSGSYSGVVETAMWLISAHQRVGGGYGDPSG